MPQRPAHEGSLAHACVGLLGQPGVCQAGVYVAQIIALAEKLTRQNPQMSEFL